LISMTHLEKALWTNIMGPEKKSMVIPEATKKLTAYHEGGHALVSLYSKDAPEIRKVTLMPRGDTLGMVNYLGKDSTEASITKSEIISKIQIAMGGRAAEESVFGDGAVTGGAASDFEKATDLAYNMVTKYGMSEVVGPICISNPDQGDEETEVVGNQREIESETRSILDRAYATAKEIIRTHIDELHTLANALLEYETLEFYELKQVLAGKKLLHKEEAMRIEKADLERKKRIIEEKRKYWENFSVSEQLDARKRISEDFYSILPEGELNPTHQ